MPSVYTFVRSDQERLEALLQVFNGDSGEAARDVWEQQAEVLVEPVGWDALWKLSKEFCKKFDLRFPKVAYVTVTSMDFETLSANVEVLSVQHESVTLPEMVHDVPLIELWPTKEQREQCVDAASTAEFIDLLRFYYIHIWMPWDDMGVLPKTISDRMQLWSEMHNGTIPNCVARNIMLIRNGAIDIFYKLKEIVASSEEMGDIDDSMLPANHVTQLAVMQAKLDSYNSQWILYEMPVVREQYIAKAIAKWNKNKTRRNVVALWEGGSISEFEEISKFLSSHVTKEHTLTITASAEEGLALDPEEVLVCSPVYEIPEVPLSQVHISSLKGATLKASEMRSCLLQLSENCTLNQLTLNDPNTSTALVMRQGTLHATRCLFTDCNDIDNQHFAQGLVAMDGASVLMEECTFENYYTAIVVQKGAQLELRNCTIKNCGLGIEVDSGAQVKLVNCTVKECREHSIRCELERPCTSLEEMKNLEIVDSTIGSGKLQKEVLIVSQEMNGI